MRVWRSTSEVPDDLGPSVVTIGNFDGCHLGHQHVVAAATETAARLGGLPVVVVTFDPHPMAVLRPEHAPSALTTIDQRTRLLGELGADAVLVVPFDTALAGWSPERFIDEILVTTLTARAVVVGANFRFGHRAAGDVALLRSVGVHVGFEIVAVELDGGPMVWSSTYIRTCLAAGDVEGAAQALGRPYAMTGVVVVGDRRGRELGFPTANVPIPPTAAAPANGVYAGRLRRLDTGEEYPAAISVGTNPTFDGHRESRVEAYCLDRTDLELYGVLVEITFVARLRGEVRFDGAEALIAEIHADVARAREILG